ncbi:MAG: hypothetical protein ABEJ07_01740 [Candidatus Nanohaloarchaea archaeon]
MSDQDVYKEAEKLKDKGRHKEAAKKFREAADKADSDADTRFWKGKAKLEEAKRDYDSKPTEAAVKIREAANIFYELMTVEDEEEAIDILHSLKEEVSTEKKQSIEEEIEKLDGLVENIEKEE